jgi:acyl-CoA synthetase (AMP-forming)/AMP-acid ligase II
MLYIDFFEKGVERYPDNVILRDGDQSWTYREMALLVNHIASALLASGLEPGDKVAIYSPNHAYVFAIQYGILRAGCVWVPMNYRNTASATAEALTHLEVDWLFFHSSLSECVRGLPDSVPSVRGRVCVDQQTDFADCLESWLSHFAERKVFPERGSADTAAILSTSGTTGKPKGIVLSNRAFATMVAEYNIMYPDKTPQTHLIVAPLSHAAGIYGATLLAHGSTNVLLHKPDPLSILKSFDQYKITTIFLPPTIIYMMLAHPRIKEFDYSSLRTILYGAAPMAVQKLHEALEIFGPVLAQAYGQSEALMMCVFLTEKDHQLALENPALVHRLKSAGREGPLARVAIMDDDGNILPANVKGEIVVRSDITMDHYYKDPQATADASKYGWHHTSDIGYKDEDGYIYIVDRKKDMIISGGFNIFPGEVEQAMLSHPSVQDCAVVGIPDQKWGEAVLAAIELKPGAEFDEAQIIAFCKDKLGSVKAPKFVKVVDSLPRSTVGKVLRREIRAQYWANQERLV